MQGFFHQRYDCCIDIPDHFCYFKQPAGPHLLIPWLGIVAATQRRHRRHLSRPELRTRRRKQAAKGYQWFATSHKRISISCYIVVYAAVFNLRNPVAGFRFLSLSTSVTMLLGYLILSMKDYTESLEPCLEAGCQTAISVSINHFHPDPSRLRKAWKNCGSDVNTTAASRASGCGGFAIN